MRQPGCRVSFKLGKSLQSTTSPKACARCHAHFIADSKLKAGCIADSESRCPHIAGSRTTTWLSREMCTTIAPARSGRWLRQTEHDRTRYKKETSDERAIWVVLPVLWQRRAAVNESPHFFEPRRGHRCRTRDTTGFRG